MLHLFHFMILTHDPQKSLRLLYPSLDYVPILTYQFPTFHKAKPNNNFCVLFDAKNFTTPYTIFHLNFIGILSYPIVVNIAPNMVTGI